jgi:hypothetical protein
MPQQIVVAVRVVINNLYIGTATAIVATFAVVIVAGVRASDVDTIHTAIGVFTTAQITTVADHAIGGVSSIYIHIITAFVVVVIATVIVTVQLAGTEKSSFEIVSQLLLCKACCDKMVSPTDRPTDRM